MSDHAAGRPADHSGQAVGAGRYRLDRLLGTGGMASVHLGYDTVLDRQIAVKTMHGELGRDDSFRERFKREAQAVAKLTHTNIVSVFDTGEDVIDGLPVPYIVMEYVDGEPLRGVLDADIRQLGAMPVDKALKITADVCAALDISHEMGLVHRDIKPGNVMVTRRGVVKVMDFGIARAMQSGVTAMTQTGMVVGTPQYLSPEQALGRGVDARSDLYSVGIMLFELLTGRLPFNADNPLAIAYAHVQEEPPAPSMVNAAVPPAVDALVARMLRKNPNERFPSAEAVKAECERLTATLGGAGTAPQITGAAPMQAGAAVSQTVFPQFGGVATPPPGGDPYTPAGTPAPVQQPYGPAGAAATPPPAAPGAYGYPHTPAPAGPGTPPPYAAATVTHAPSSSGGDGGGKSMMWVLIAAVTAIVLVAGVAIVAVVSSGGTEQNEAQGGGEQNGAEDPQQNAGDDAGGTAGGADEGDDAGAAGGTEESTEPDEREPRYKEGDETKTIDVTECTHADEYYDQDEHPGAVSMPDFYDVHFASVKECMQKAEWLYDDEERDEALKGEGMVVDQTPEPYSPFDPEKDTITIVISTGYEAAN
ncbi:Stk1 family PASTA domain-containing Ser/Thr kinase [Streptomyces aidingensis]|uniref:non-specific serine/threonine protein kinase n=1 Tax=Streptomyces aidingensis TaxID=910347 RepID=A0A1I1JZG1_9ACTN|nr:Stk1 family PASTA domain-containing Ser/Thr kinase [Streptomyces aidingensis]SFC53775.1 Serine/threonine protein kinase [Streptomyces aidingensis]